MQLKSSQLEAWDDKHEIPLTRAIPIPFPLPSACVISSDGFPDANPRQPMIAAQNPGDAPGRESHSWKEVLAMFAPRRIIVPTDFTEDSDRALKEAIDIATVSHGKVYLLHVDQSVPIVIGNRSSSRMSSWPSRRMTS
jgi:hypothetical protein